MPTVLATRWWCCDGCGALYAQPLYGGCPSCRGTAWHLFGTRPEDEEHPMSPKITRHSGPTVAGVEPRVVDEPTAPPAATREGEVLPREDEPAGEPVATEREFPADDVEKDAVEVALGALAELTGDGSALPPADEAHVEPADVEHEERLAEASETGGVSADAPISEPEPPDEEPTNANVREWARANGFVVSDSGPVRREVREAYDTAHAG